MREVEPGDLIFSFCDTRIKAVGVALATASTAPKPDFGGTGANWSNEGWFLPVEFAELNDPPRPKDRMDLIRPHLPNRYAPLQPNTGNGSEAVYLTSVPEALANALISLIGAEYVEVLQSLQGELDETDAIEDQQEQAIKGRTDIGATTKYQLERSRRGQGIFRANVRLNEKKCRLTGVTDPKHLRASHIKPWKDCNDEEKLNGCNGLLLAPHIDHLFDGGMISFTDSGDLIISPRLDREILTKWSIPQTANVGRFSDEQLRFMDYHRISVLKK